MLTLIKISHRVIYLSAIVLGTALPSYAQEGGGKTEDGFVSIFDGKTMNGWKLYASQKDQDKNFWTIGHGMITADTMATKDHGAMFLFYEKELTDFELKLKFQAYRKSPGNSGVQVRSRYRGKNVDGPQFDIHPPAPFRTGLLYDESEQYNRWISPSKPSWKISPQEVKHQAPFYYADDKVKWNVLHIICKGTSMKSILNGVLVTDFDGKGILDDEIHARQNVGMKGKIGLQVHNKDRILIRFKDILLKDTATKK